jgi:hypothetical protein
LLNNLTGKIFDNGNGGVLVTTDVAYEVLKATGKLKRKCSFRHFHRLIQKGKLELKGYKVKTIPHFYNRHQSKYLIEITTWEDKKALVSLLPDRDKEQSSHNAGEETEPVWATTRIAYKIFTHNQKINCSYRHFRRLVAKKKLNCNIKDGETKYLIELTDTADINLYKELTNNQNPVPVKRHKFKELDSIWQRAMEINEEIIKSNNIFCVPLKAAYDVVRVVKGIRISYRQFTRIVSKGKFYLIMDRDEAKVYVVRHPINKYQKRFYIEFLKDEHRYMAKRAAERHGYTVENYEEPIIRRSVA